MVPLKIVVHTHVHVHATKSKSSTIIIGLHDVINNTVFSKVCFTSTAVCIYVCEILSLIEAFVTYIPF